MDNQQTQFIKDTCRQVGNDRARLMDVAREVQARLGCIDGQALDLIAQELAMHRVEVESLVSFYAFLSGKPKGATVIRLCDDIVDVMQGVERVAEVFSQELGIQPGETTADGRITLEWTPCIGMCDQAPAALINDIVVTQLDGDKARAMARLVKAGGASPDLVKTLGDGNNAHELVRSAVHNNIRARGPVVFEAFESGTALRKALAMTPAEVVRDVKTSRLRGRGGAGFPTGMKWDFTRQSNGANRYVICNADEGEPGTFKDRVMLTECPDLMLEGMTIAGYAVGAAHGILYLRGEYAYLNAFLEDALAARRAAGWLGANIAGRKGFDFDIRIQMGAGAYVCGEETSLISSCEGLRGDPKTRPPFPAQKGYLGCPTDVNNVETFCCVARILDKGPGWFAQMGSKGSPGTKVLSVSGDCRRPGVYEVPFGIPLRDLLKLAGGEQAAAVQVGGPSGQMVGPADFHRTLCYDDLATGGAITVFGPERNLLDVVRKFNAFFLEESCGYCTPCRVGNRLMKDCLDRIAAGKGEPCDLDYLQALGQAMKVTSRCGLGQTACNPVLTTLKNFKPMYDRLVTANADKWQPGFDIKAELAQAEAVAGRSSVHF
ncbi:MAG: NAD(P)H-dependent oxidoreductase subunit E [bacterium]